jgi:hypothetical protein
MTKPLLQPLPQLLLKGEPQGQHQALTPLQLVVGQQQGAPLLRVLTHQPHQAAVPSTTASGGRLSQRWVL